jgi:hypothetical protein
MLAATATDRDAGGGCGGIPAAMSAMVQSATPKNLVKTY